MINRLLIRIKTAQLVYAFIQSEQPRINCDDQLIASLESSYKLYNYLLGLIVKVTDFRHEILEAARNKYLPTNEERFPNERFVNNGLAKMIRENSSVMDYCDEHNLFNDFDADLYRVLFEQIEEMPLYKTYMSQPKAPTFEQDKELWKEVFNTIIPKSEKLDEILEEKDIFWNDDISTILEFVVKTITRIKPEADMIKLLEMFRDDDERKFATELFHHSVDECHEYLKIIEETAKNWQGSRIAMMEKVIMICALAEIKNFPDIPARISLNEYIELAKYYCTKDSARFINGILDKIVTNWKKQGIIFK
ncbi:MAG: transcription antitermination factor NusB [Bacteroidales bacterium]|nr:transcription antitermination factor NusB [Bacteroidales bacterium]